MECTPGERETLAAVVEEHVRTGEAAGSQAVSHRVAKPVSSATIRNRMAALESKGLLSHPHTSAGRVPTDAGYRYYVDELLPASPPDPQVVRTVAASLQSQQDLEPALQLTCRLLAELTKQASLASPPDWQEERLQYVEVRDVSRHQVLLVVIGSSGRISHSVVTMSAAPDRVTLRVFSRRLNEHFHGAKLSTITAEALMGVAQGLTAGPEFCRQAAEVLRSPGGASRSFLLDGASNMLAYQEFQDTPRLQALMALLEQDHPLADLLGRATTERVTLLIGVESAQPALEDCALVCRAYRLADGTTGTVAVLGPKRMRYDLAIANLNLVVDFLNRALWGAAARA